MNRLFFFLLYSICSWSAFGQGQLNYQTQIIGIEKLILEGDFEKALKGYEALFDREGKIAYAKDFHNAVLCGIRAGDLKAAFQFADSLVCRGVRLEYFYQPIFTGLIKEEILWKEFEKKYRGIFMQIEGSKNIAEQRYNFMLRAELEYLLAQDQYYRKQPNGYQLFKDSIEAMDRRVFSRSKEMIDRYGFPNEQLIGNENPQTMHPLYIILRHAVQGKIAEANHLVQREFQAGRMHPILYAKLNDIRSDQIFGTRLIEQVNGRLFKKEYQDERSMNHKRASIGLHSIEDEQRILLFLKKNEGFLFNRIGGVAVLSFISNKEAEAFIEKNKGAEIK